MAGMCPPFTNSQQRILRHSLVPPVVVAMVPHDVLHRCQDVVKGLK